jgi:hypothetical protein
VLLPWKKGQAPSFDKVYGSSKEHQTLHTKALYTRVHNDLEDIVDEFGSNPTELKRRVRQRLQAIAEQLLDGNYP